MTFDEAIRAFRQRFAGQVVRAQMVEDVEISAETYGDEVRYFARLFFRENPPTNQSPERNLLERVFSEIPPCADELCSSWEDLVAVVTGEKPADWRLEDEPRAKKKADAV